MLLKTYELACCKKEISFQYTLLFKYLMSDKKKKKLLKLILLFSEDAFNCSKVTVKTFII